MNVPPYVPQPIEIPGNVAEEPYNLRLTFLRKVAALYAVSVAVVAVFACVQILDSPIIWALILAALLLLSLCRALSKGRAREQLISLALSPLLFVSLGSAARHLFYAGFPTWAIPSGALFAAIYTLCCGRDLSFMAMWFLSLIVSTAWLLTVGTFTHALLSFLGIALVLNAAYTSYWVYDLAALLTRRRMGEEVGAVLDLYRDVLNMFSYPIRVWEHWRTHRIWSARA
jgi:hypothetical protein